MLRSAMINELTIREKIDLFSELGQSICCEGIKKEILKELIDRKCHDVKSMGRG